jgi:hypothetical protein
MSWIAMKGHHFRLSERESVQLDELVEDAVVCNGTTLFGEALNRSMVLRWLIREAHKDMMIGKEDEAKRKDAAIAADVKKALKIAKKPTVKKSHKK